MVLQCNDKNEIKEFYDGGTLLGVGKTAEVYLKDEKAFKVYRDCKTKRRLFEEIDMKYHLNCLSEIKVKNIWTPNNIYAIKSDVEMIDLDWVKGKNLRDETPDVSMSLFLDYLNELVENGTKLGEHRVLARDFFNCNAIVNQSGINIIDTDEYNIMTFDETSCIEHNLNLFVSTILDSFFETQGYFTFESKQLNSLYRKVYADAVDYKDYLNFYCALCEEFGGNESIKNLKSLIKTLGEVKK